MRFYTTADFISLDIIDVFHKENEGTTPSSAIKNYHCLARARYSYSGGSAVLDITADDCYKLYINGTFVCLGPAPSYSDNYFYNSLDISDYLVEGENIIAVHLYYQGLVNRVWQSGDNRFCVCGAVNNADLCWKYKVSRAFCGSINGYDTDYSESFDSRLWDNEWCKPSYDDSQWEQMLVRDYDYNLVSQSISPLSVYKIKPEKIEKYGNTYKIDIGQEIAGTLYLRCSGESGAEVIIRCGEELKPDGSVRYKLRAGCTYEEKWILSDGESIYDGYCYKGFRYVEIISAYSLSEISAFCRHYPFDDAYCQVKFKDIRLEKIFCLCKNTIKYSTQDTFIDCPTREKGQYLGDVFISGHSHALLTGSTALLEHAVDDFAMSSKICKGLMAVAPCSLMQEIADYSLIFGELLLITYQLNDSRAFLEKHYDTAKDVIVHFKKYERTDGLLDCVADKWNLVDWPEGLRDNYDFVLSRPVVQSGVHNVINAYYVGAVATLNKIEDILKKPHSFDFEALKRAYINAFFKGSLFADSEVSEHCSLHSNALALYFGLVPENYRDTVADFIVKKGFSCGVYMSYFVMKALARAGRRNELFSLLVNDGEHGWLNMIREGATTCFEAWGKEQKHNTSLCHAWASAPISIILEDLKDYAVSENE